MYIILSRFFQYVSRYYNTNVFLYTITSSEYTSICFYIIYPILWDKVLAILVANELKFKKSLFNTHTL